MLLEIPTRLFHVIFRRQDNPKSLYVKTLNFIGKLIRFMRKVFKANKKQHICLDYSKKLCGTTANKGFSQDILTWDIKGEKIVQFP